MRQTKSMPCCPPVRVCDEDERIRRKEWRNKKQSVRECFIVDQTSGRKRDPEVDEVKEMGRIM